MRSWGFRTPGLVVALVVVASAQEPIPSFRAGASYVRVDVFPTAKGEPVTDLRQDEFEILEDKVPQKLDAFEHIVIRGSVADDSTQEPKTVAESRALVRTGRGRVFVLFLDSFHVEALVSTTIRKPLVDALDRALGPDDLLAVMTADMSARDLTFTPKRGSAEAILATVWGQRDTLVVDDPLEEMYRRCYPPVPVNCATSDCKNGLGIADDMIQRRREAKTFAALRDLVGYLGGAREERKAVLVVTDGWLLFEPNQDLARPTPAEIGSGPGTPGTINPRTGRPASGAAPALNAPGAVCTQDKMAFAMLDDRREAIDIEQQANRANVSFYPIDPRGLAAYDESPVANNKTDVRTGKFAAPEPAVSPKDDIKKLSDRLQSLRALAENTDGLAIVNSNNIAPALRKMTDDLSSYYLLGYSSTGRLDGKFHAITVRVKRPGVDVRARKGFMASTMAEAAAKTAAAEAALGSTLTAEASAVASAIGSLGFTARDESFHLQAAAGWQNGNSHVWAVGEVDGDEWKNGGDVDLSLVDPEKDTRASEHVSVAAGSRNFRVLLTPPAGPIESGTYFVLAKSHSAGGAITTTTSRLEIGEPPVASGALMLRRGPTTGNRDAPTADARFRRTERIRVDVPAATEAVPAARLLDRNGRAMPVPMTATVRDDADGSRWQTTQLTLAPFAPGDYLIELTTKAGTETARALVAFRIVP